MHHSGSHLSGRVGWEILFCPKCAYAIEKCSLTRNYTYCPLCDRKGEQVKLEDRYIVHLPENKVIKPLAEMR